MRLVKQEEFGQCGAACLAMVLGMEFSDVVEELKCVHGPLEMGLSDDEMIDFLRSHGIACPRAVMDWNGSDPAILTVPSLNSRGFLHYIAWDGERFHDPSEGPLLYPQDAPRVGGEAMVFWATAIVWG
jgi:hypothetical protein